MLLKLRNINLNCWFLYKDCFTLIYIQNYICCQLLNRQLLAVNIHFKKTCVQVGQIPGDWAHSLIPLIQTGNVRVDGKCQCAPATLSLLDSIVVLLW
jgi:hypothetical protein